MLHLILTCLDLADGNNFSSFLVILLDYTDKFRMLMFTQQLLFFSSSLSSTTSHLFHSQTSFASLLKNLGIRSFCSSSHGCCCSSRRLFYHLQARKPKSSSRAIFPIPFVNAEGKRARKMKRRAAIRQEHDQAAA